MADPSDNMDSETFYDILGISPKATIEEIRASFRAKAKFWHPDKNKDKEATTKFQQINMAYTTLRDPHARADYDQENGISQDTNNTKDSNSMKSKYSCQNFTFKHNMYCILIHLGQANTVQKWIDCLQNVLPRCTHTK